MLASGWCSSRQLYEEHNDYLASDVHDCNHLTGRVGGLRIGGYV
jgi:hypothetical protein